LTFFIWCVYPIDLIPLAQGTVYSNEEVQSAGGHFLPYAGVSIPDYNARTQLNKAIRRASIIGVPISRKPLFQNLFFRLARHYKWPLQRMQLTTSLINFELADTTNLYRSLLQQHQVLLIGNQMPLVKEKYENEGITNIVGAITIDGTKSIPEVLSQAERYEYEVVLVSAGVATAIICPKFSKLGKVAIDFGHMADKLVKNSRSI
jgi:hypothetical protein